MDQYTIHHHTSESQTVQDSILILSGITKLNFSSKEPSLNHYASFMPMETFDMPMNLLLLGFSYSDSHGF